MATHSSIPAWIIPWTEEPDRLQSVGSQRVRQDRAAEHILMYFVPGSVVHTGDLVVPKQYPWRLRSNEEGIDKKQTSTCS